MIFFGCLFLFNAIKGYQESQALNNYLQQIPNLESFPMHTQAIKVSQKLREDFNIDQTSWKYISKKKEPFLKFSALNLIKWKEGHCGKGTRVLVLLLRKLGMNATRVTLYGKDYKNASSHTLASVLIKGEEYLIDSINSNEKWNDQLTNGRTSTQHLFGNHQSDPKVKERMIKHSYVNYSYEAYPLVMISKGLGLKNIRFNHLRPLKIVSTIMESVYTQMTIFSLGLLFFTAITFKFMNNRYNREMLTA